MKNEERKEIEIQKIWFGVMGTLDLASEAL